MPGSEGACVGIDRSQRVRIEIYTGPRVNTAQRTNIIFPHTPKNENIMDGLKDLIKSKRILSNQRLTAPKKTRGTSLHSPEPNGVGSNSVHSFPEESPSDTFADTLHEHRLVEIHAHDLGSMTKIEAQSSDASSGCSPSISVSEIFSFLRDHGEPCTIFGETAEERIERYEKMKRSKNSMASGSQMARPPVSLFWDADFLEVASTSDPVGVDILRWIQSVLRRWDQNFSGPKSTDHSPSDEGGADDERVLLQTTETLLPLIRKLQNDTVDHHLKLDLHEFVKHAVAHRYADASKAYLKISIGNAAWPIGVGKVFIQERASMDRIATASHLLNNDAARRYVQALKRLLTRSAVFWPATDPAQNIGI